MSLVRAPKHGRYLVVYSPVMTTNKIPNTDAKDGLSYQPESPSPSHLEDHKPRLLVDTDEDEEFSYAEQRSIVHRIDRRLVVILGLMYCVSLIDRGNMPNAVRSSSSLP